jgi:hypothetical protein
MIHYHGTPITPRAELLKMAGKNFCVSFANPYDADWCLSHGQTVMWDNGAFSFHTQGKATDWKSYYEWLEPRLGHPHWAVVPDVIDGAPAENMELAMQWPHEKSLACAVWHLAEPIGQLLKLLDMGFGKIAFGSSGVYWQVGSPAWARRTDEAFNTLARNGSLPWIHMMRGLSLCGDQWPFASADSVNVARNHKDAATCPERMARRIDAIQCPIKWHMKDTQRDMFNAA